MPLQGRFDACATDEGKKAELEELYCLELKSNFLAGINYFKDLNRIDWSDQESFYLHLSFIAQAAQELDLHAYRSDILSSLQNIVALCIRNNQFFNEAFNFLMTFSTQSQDILHKVILAGILDAFHSEFPSKFSPENLIFLFAFFKNIISSCRVNFLLFSKVFPLEELYLFLSECDLSVEVVLSLFELIKSFFRYSLSSYEVDFAMRSLKFMFTYEQKVRLQRPNCSCFGCDFDEQKNDEFNKSSVCLFVSTMEGVRLLLGKRKPVPDLFHFLNLMDHITSRLDSHPALTIRTLGCIAFAVGEKFSIDLDMLFSYLMSDNDELITSASSCLIEIASSHPHFFDDVKIPSLIESILRKFEYFIYSTKEIISALIIVLLRMLSLSALFDFVDELLIQVIAFSCSVKKVVMNSLKLVDCLVENAQTGFDKSWFVSVFAEANGFCNLLHIKDEEETYVSQAIDSLIEKCQEFQHYHYP